MRDTIPPKFDGGYLAEFGATLIDNGYNIVPINGGKKAPILPGWSKLESTKEELKKWLSESGGYRAGGGVGIITKRTPAIDIDVRDENIADQVEQFVREMLGDAPLRIGRAPKRLMVFKTSEPFSKMSSRKYRDEWDEEHQIEILGDGQQFVAYHVHPDIRRPYIWPNDDGPAIVKREDLIEITADQARSVIAFFEDLAAGQSDWKVVGKARAGRRATDIDDGMFANMVKTDKSLDEMREMLMQVSDVETRDVWLGVGMALHYEYDASNEAFELWNDWSSAGSTYDPADQAYRWSGFGVEAPGKEMLGGAFIIDLYNKELSTRAAAMIPKLKQGLNDASTTDEWEAAVKAVAESEIGPRDRENMVGIAKKKIDRMQETPMPVATMRKMLAYQSKANEKIPTWLQGWVYDTENDAFFSTELKMSVTKQGFGAMFDHKAFTEKDKVDKKGRPSTTADDLALNIHQINKVHGKRYAPGETPIFDDYGIRRANTYAEFEIPLEPKTITPQDKLNIKRVKEHVAHLLSNPKEQAMLLDWLSWIVQHPGQHVNYAVLLQGIQGDGKSFFGRLMRAVMGQSNVRLLSASVLESNFTGWAVGQCMTCIEEVSMRGEDRFKTLNKIKDIISNDDINVTFKGKDPVTLRNTTSYMLLSNYQDAVPLEEKERRYMILFSRWQDKEDLAEFMEANPRYYSNLYMTIVESAPAIRKWLLEREQGESFDAKGHAPVTDAHRVMVNMARPQFIRDVREVIEEGNNPLITDNLIHFTELQGHLESHGYSVPDTRAMSDMLARAGYAHMGKFRYNGPYVHFYSKRPRQFLMGSDSSMEYSGKKVREFADLQKKKAECDDDDEI